MEIKMYNVGFGECIQLHSNNSKMLIDCGSELTNSRSKYPILRDEVFKRIMNETEAKQSDEKPDAMISHFHTDHINGFYWMEKQHPKIFGRVFIPDIFTLNKHPNYLDVTILEQILRSILYPGAQTTTLWDFLDRLIENNENIVPLCRKQDAFSFDNHSFDVLWPAPNMEPTKEAEEIFEQYGIAEIKDRVYLLSDNVQNSIQQHDGHNYDNTFRIKSVNRRIPAIKNRLLKAIQKQDNNKSDGYSKQLSPEQVDRFRDYYERMKKEINNTSIVCQAECDKKPALFTGDVEAETLSWIIRKEDNQIPCFPYYYVIKAPHHGTESHYIKFDVKYTYLLISNGFTSYFEKSRGPVSAQYKNNTKGIVLCTNVDPDRCEFWENNEKPCPGCSMKYNMKEYQMGVCWNCESITV